MTCKVEGLLGPGHQLGPRRFSGAAPARGGTMVRRVWVWGLVVLLVLAAAGTVAYRAGAIGLKPFPGGIVAGGGGGAAASGGAGPGRAGRSSPPPRNAPGRCRRSSPSTATRSRRARPASGSSSRTKMRFWPRLRLLAGSEGARPGRRGPSAAKQVFHQIEFCLLTGE